MSHISALLVKGHLLLQLQAKGTVHPAMSIDFCDGQRWRRKSACCANATWLKGPKSCKEDDSCFCPLRLKGPNCHLRIPAPAKRSAGTSMTGADFFPIRELSTYQACAKTGLVFWRVFLADVLYFARSQLIRAPRTTRFGLRVRC